MKIQPAETALFIGFEKNFKNKSKKAERKGTLITLIREVFHYTILIQLKLISVKKELLKFSDVHLLKRNEKLLPECLYILNSESVAQNTYFETKRDIQRAHEMMKKHLSPVMDIIDYLFTPNGWMIVVSIKSEKEVLKGLDRRRYKSKKIKSAIRNKSISKILSEVLRYAISGIARIINRYNKRGGTLVRCNFNRFIFNSIEAIQEIMKKMNIEQIKLIHQKERYRPSMKWFDKEGELAQKGNVYLCSKNDAKLIKSNVSGQSAIAVVSKSIDVLRKILRSTLIKHPIPKSPNPINFSPQISSNP